MKKRLRQQQNETATASGSPHPSIVGRYHDKALRENQPRLTDLIPRSMWAYLSMILLGVMSVYGIHRGYSWAQQSEIAPAGLFDLLKPGSISAWFMSFLLLMISAASAQLYLLRRHRMDDYRGNYRCWLWIGIVTILLSIDAATGAHRMISMMIDPLEIDGVWSNASTWWVCILSLVCGYQMVRVLIETRYRPLICLTSAAGLTALIAAAVITVGLWPQATIESKALLIHGGLFAYMMTTWFFARRIYLDAQVDSDATDHVEVRQTTRRIRPIAVVESLDHTEANSATDDETEVVDEEEITAEDSETVETEYYDDDVQEDVEEQTEYEVAENDEGYLEDDEVEEEEEEQYEQEDGESYYIEQEDEEQDDEYSYQEYESDEEYGNSAYEEQESDEEMDIVAQFKDAGWDDEEVELLAQLEREQKELERIAAEQTKADEEDLARSSDETESKKSVILGPDGKSISDSEDAPSRDLIENDQDTQTDSSIVRMPNPTFNHGGSMPPVPQNEEEEMLLAQYDWPRMSKNQRKKLRKRLSRMRRGQAA